jgi:hypothetical protein
MYSQEKRLIDALFRKLSETAAQSGPRDREVEAIIDRHVERLPGATYYMAQVIIVQHEALKQAEKRIDALEGRGRGSFLPQQPARQAPNRSVQHPSGQSGGGFLASAAQTALGIGGGILLANASMDLARDIFGDSYDEGDVMDAYTAGYEDSEIDFFEADDFDLGDDFDLDF